ncbi:YtpI family protein [Bacillus sp. FJAT-45350]|uniref:YtpI family protein n=1 Tax=Bacillus sp. FJAT-45350 TaxID=2011014 RepID=UPI000BB95D93|nr:YtpI family protein [Bacillus sp. FJAT-45350]
MAQSFVILIVIALAFFIYFKVKFWRTKSPVEKNWIQSKANMSLGAFLAFFGLNLLLFPRSNIDITIGIIFTLLGATNTFLGYRNYKHFLPQVLDEASQNR